MDRLATSTGWAPAASAEAVALPRRHLLVVAALVCIPIPLFSVGAMFVPLPQLLERAAASFVSIAAPRNGKQHVIREEAGSKPLAIVYRDDEVALAASAPAPARRPSRSAGSPARGGRKPASEAGRVTPLPGARSQVSGSAPPLATGEQAGPGSSESAPATDTPDRTDPPAGQQQGGTEGDPPKSSAQPVDSSPKGGGSQGGSGSSGGSGSGTGGTGTGSGGSGGSGSSGGSGGSGGQGGGSGGSSGSGGQGGGSGGSGGSGGGSTPTEPPKASPGTGGNSGGGSGGGPSETTPPRNDSAQPPKPGGRP